MYENILSYLKTINWTKRLDREIPVLAGFLSSLSQTTPKKSMAVLDLGCGPGKHLQELCHAFPDDHFSGLDLNPAMIAYAQDQAKLQNCNITYYAKDFLADNVLDNSKFDMIYSLGNSFALIWGGSNASPEQLVAKVSRLLKPGGIVFFQILNSENPRNGYWTSKITKITEDQEVFTVKRFEPNLSTHRMHVEFISFTRNLSDQTFVHEVKTSTWPLITTEALTKLLQNQGFTDFLFWENYNKTPLTPSTSGSRLCFAKKNPSGML